MSDGEREEVRFTITMSNLGNVNLEGCPDSAVLAYGHSKQVI